MDIIHILEEQTTVMRAYIAKGISINEQEQKIKERIIESLEQLDKETYPKLYSLRSENLIRATNLVYDKMITGLEISNAIQALEQEI